MHCIVVYEISAYWLRILKTLFDPFGILNLAMGMFEFASISKFISLINVSYCESLKQISYTDIHNTWNEIFILYTIKYVILRIVYAALSCIMMEN